MAEGRYTRVKSIFWIDEKVKPWGDDEKFLALYLLTSPHNNILGCHVIPKLYICADIGWDIKRLNKVFNVLLSDKFIKYDESNNLLFISNYLKHNPIENGNQAKGAEKQLAELPKSIILQDLKQALKQLDKPFLKPLIERIPEPNAKPVTVTTTVTETVTTTTPLPPTSPADDFDPAQIEVEDNRRRSLETFEQEYSRLLGPTEIQTITEWTDKFGPDLIVHALKKAVLQGNRSMSYIGGILNRWDDSGLRTVQEVEDHEAKWKKEKEQNKSSPQAKARQPDKPQYETFVPPATRGVV